MPERVKAIKLVTPEKNRTAQFKRVQRAILPKSELKVRTSYSDLTPKRPKFPSERQVLNQFVRDNQLDSLSNYCNSITWNFSLLAKWRSRKCLLPF